MLSSIITKIQPHKQLETCKPYTRQGLQLRLQILQLKCGPVFRNTKTQQSKDFLQDVACFMSHKFYPKCDSSYNTTDCKTDNENGRQKEVLVSAHRYLENVSSRKSQL
jgi:hypothetical protein